MTPFTLLGFATALAACLCLYSASPNQHLWRHPWPALASRSAAGLLLCLSWLSLRQDMQRLTASFVLATLLMLLLALLPYLGAWLLLHRQR